MGNCIDGLGGIDGLTGGAAGGDVVGPGSAVDENIVVFDGTTGKIIKDSGVNLSAINDAVEGPGSSIDGHIVAFDGTTGKLIKQVSDVILRATSGTDDPTIVIQDSGGTPEFVISVDFSSGNNGIVSASPLRIETTGSNTLDLTTGLGTIDIFTTGASNFVSIRKTGNDDEDHILEIQNTGTNAGNTLIHVGDRTPEGNVTAPDGAIYYRTDSSPAIYLKTGGVSLTNWVELLHTGSGAGDVSGPASSIDNTIAMFDGVTGKVIDQAVDVLYASTATTRNVRIDSPSASGVIGWELHDFANVKRGELTYTESAGVLALVQRDNGNLEIETTGTGNIRIDTTAANSTIELSCGSTGSITLDAGPSDWIFGNDTLSTTASGGVVTSRIEFKNVSATTVATIDSNNNFSQLVLSTPTNYNIEFNCTDGNIRLITQASTNRLIIDNAALPDTLPGIEILQGGANGGRADVFVGSRNPEGLVTGNGGNVYIRDSATVPAIFLKVGDTSNTGWGKVKVDNGDTVASLYRPLSGSTVDIQYSSTAIQVEAFTFLELTTPGSLVADVANDRINILDLDDVLVSDTYRVTFNATFSANVNAEIVFDIRVTGNGSPVKSIYEVSQTTTGASDNKNVCITGIVTGPNVLIGNNFISVFGSTIGASAFVRWRALQLTVERIR